MQSSVLADEEDARTEFTQILLAQLGTTEQKALFQEGTPEWRALDAQQALLGNEIDQLIREYPYFSVSEQLHSHGDSLT